MYLQAFIKSNTIAEEKEWYGLCYEETRQRDIADSTFRQRVDESSRVKEKPSVLKRSQSMRIPKSRKLKEGIEKQKQCVTLEETETRLEDSEKICPYDMVVRRKIKLGNGTMKPGCRLIENENSWTSQPKEQWQSLHPRVDRLENSLKLTGDISDRNELSQSDDRTRPTSSRRMTTKTIYGQRNQETITIDANINSDSDGDIVLHSKGLATNYKLSKTATVSRLKHSSVVPTDSPLSYHREIKASDDEFIRIWRFGQTSEFITFPKVRISFLDSYLLSHFYF